MEELKLNEQHNTELNSGVVRFYVPESEKRECKNRFENYDIADWAELNYLADIEPHND